MVTGGVAGTGGSASIRTARAGDRNRRQRNTLVRYADHGGRAGQAAQHEAADEGDNQEERDELVRELRRGGSGDRRALHHRRAVQSLRPAAI